MSETHGWFGPVSGLLSATGVVAGMNIFGGIEADPSNSESTVLAQYAESADEVGTAGFIVMFGIGFLLIFLGDVRSRYRAAGASWPADVFLAGGVAFAGAMILGVGIDLAGGVAGENGHVEVAQMAVDFAWESAYLFTPGLLAMGVAAATAAFGHRAQPRWLGALAVLVALGALAPWIGVMVFIAWMVLASLVGVVGARKSMDAAVSA